MPYTRVIVKQLLPPIILTLRRKLLQFAFTLRQKLSQHSPHHVPSSKMKDLYYDHIGRNKHCTFNEICLRNDLTLKIHPASRSGFEYFCYAPEMVEELDSFIHLSQGRLNFLDIGAYHGIFSLVFTKNVKDRRAVAIDSSPLAFSRLLYNMHKNAECNITALECAMSKEPGNLTMFYDEWEHTISAPTVRSSDRSILVETKTGDILCSELNFIPDIIKIDVEGHEVKVLKGLHGILGRYNPLVFLEVHPSGIAREGDRISDILEFVHKNGYHVCLTDARKLSAEELQKLQSITRLILVPS